MKIGLIELQNHIEVLRNFCLLLVDTEHEVTVVCKKNIADELLAIYPAFQRMEWRHIKEKEKQGAILRRYQSTLSSLDLLFLITLKRFSFSAMQLLRYRPFVLVVHNCNSLFFPFQHLCVSSESFGKDLLRLFHFILAGRFWVQARIREAAQATGVASSFMKNYLSQRLNGPNIKIMPFALYEGSIDSPRGSDLALTIVIPGTVDESLRDYKQVAAALSKVVDAVEPVIHLCLLGQLKKKASPVLHHFATFLKKGGRLEYFEEAIPQHAFDQKLRAADFLILPLSPEKKVGIFREFTGYSSISGSINDMVRWGIPALAPRDYPLSDSMEKLVLRYSSAEELAEKIIYWVNSREFRSLRSRAGSLLEEYSLPAQRKILEEQIRTLCKGHSL